MIAKHITEDGFFKACNGKCRERLFTDKDFTKAQKAMGEARASLKAGDESFIAFGHGHHVGKNYGFKATTAYWYVFIKGGEVFCSFGRVQLRNNGKVPRLHRVAMKDLKGS